ncbi:hypothetical protein LTR53_010285 [Teratosphaeriaceae sp. CCFEE 6253]|nr:hypothetical protein LTR53_010285 [Teratosphaeriaceae sp. CCFEE 6253]
MLRRFLPFAAIGFLTTLFFLVVYHNVSWRGLPQAVGLGEADGPSEEQKMHALPDLRVGKPQYESPAVGEGAFKEPKMESNSPYALGQVKPAGSNYTKCLVVPRLGTEDTSWIDGELGDMLGSGALTKAIYTVDDRSAPLHPPKNKGHEVTVYLTHLIDFYDELADVTLFMHFHRFAWHNNELMDTDAALMVRHLSPERVSRDGYMNLRCHWDPGCPSWLHPGAIERNYDKMEETLVADAWAELFPLDPIPGVLAQPCCAQFAVSRDRIRALPKERYVVLRDWILRTQLSDYMSGRVFEYIWQYIFTASPVHCPSMSACYCDGYGFCFGSPKNFDYWFELRYKREQHRAELAVWREKARLIEVARGDSKDGRIDEEAELEVPAIGRNTWLEVKIREIDGEMEGLKRQAFERGRDPEQRALEAGRPWREGDGF